jgi:hypothetical protein
VIAQRGAVEAPVRTHPADDYPVPTDRLLAQCDAPFARLAVAIHQGEDWPSGRLCRNCRPRFPCGLARWGHGVLVAAGWTSADVARFLAQAVGSAAAGSRWTFPAIPLGVLGRPTCQGRPRQGGGLVFAWRTSSGSGITAAPVVGGRSVMTATDTPLRMGIAAGKAPSRVERPAVGYGAAAGGLSSPGPGDPTRCAARCLAWRGHRIAGFAVDSRPRLHCRSAHGRAAAWRREVPCEQALQSYHFRGSPYAWPGHSDGAGKG